MPRASLLLALLLVPAVHAQKVRVVGNTPGKSREATAVVFAPDGKTVLSAQASGGVQLHDPDTGKKIADVEVPGEGVLAVAVAPDGKTFATAGRDGVVRLWDLATRKEIKELKGHRDAAAAVAFSPDGLRLASGGYEGAILIWDIKEGKPAKSWGSKARRVTALAFTPDGKQLLSGGAGIMPVVGFPIASADNARLWNVADGKEVAAWATCGSVAALSPDGRIAAVGGYQLEVGGPGDKGQIRINQTTLNPAWRVALVDRATGRETLRLNEGGALALSPDGRFLATGRGTQMHTQGLGNIQLGSAAPAGGVTLWETQTGLAVRKLALADADSTVLAISPDGTRLAVGGRDGRVQFASLTPEGWDAEKAKKAGDKELESAWADLAGEPAKAYAGIWLMSATPESAAKLLSGKLAPVKVDRERIKKLVVDLDARRFATREAALKELKQMGMDAEPELRRIAKGELSAEVAKRVGELLTALDGHSPAPEALRPLRAVLILERSRTPAAREVLERLAKGEPEAQLTKAATAALERMGK